MYNLSVIYIKCMGCIADGRQFSNILQGGGSISRKKFHIIYPMEEPNEIEQLEKTIENAVLLTLLEKKCISLQQYRQCSARLGLRGGENEIYKGFEI